MTNFADFEASFGLVPRSSESFLDLPAKYRWEFTRRHPYYQACWQLAAKYRRCELGPDPDELLDGYCAMHLLGMIGVSGTPEDPCIPFDKLSEPLLGSSTVQPITMRSIVQALIKCLPPAELCAVGATMIQAGDKEYAIPEDDDLTLQRRKAQLALVRMPSQALDSYLSCPLYYIHLSASQRRIVDDLEIEVRQWKQVRNIPERRVRTQDFDEFLAIWDLREGWHNGIYNISEEQPLAQIASTLGLPRSTVASRYRAAFRHILGSGFSQEKWLSVIGIAKNYLSSEPNRLSLISRYRRILVKNERQPIPETQLTPSSDPSLCNRMIESKSAVRGEQLVTDIWLDLHELIQRGLSDSEIAQKLELPESSITHLRDRIAEITEDLGGAE